MKEDDFEQKINEILIYLFDQNKQIDAIDKQFFKIKLNASKFGYNEIIVSSVYYYFFPAYKKYAKNTGNEFWFEKFKKDNNHYTEYNYSIDLLINLKEYFKNKDENIYNKESFEEVTKFSSYKNIDLFLLFTKDKFKELVCHISAFLTRDLNYFKEVLSLDINENDNFEDFSTLKKLFFEEVKYENYVKNEEIFNQLSEAIIEIKNDHQQKEEEVKQIVEELNNKNNQLTKEIIEIKNEHQQKEEEVKQIVEELNNKNNQLTKEIIEKENEHQQKEEEVKQIVEELNNKNNQLTKEIIEIKNEHQQKEEEVKQIVEELNNKNNQLTKEIIEIKKDHRQKEENLTQTVNDLKNDKIKSYTEIEKLKKDIDKINEKIDKIYLRDTIKYSIRYIYRMFYSTFGNKKFEYNIYEEIKELKIILNKPEYKKTYGFLLNFIENISFGDLQELNRVSHPSLEARNLDHIKKYLPDNNGDLMII